MTWCPEIDFTKEYRLQSAQLVPTLFTNRPSNSSSSSSSSSIFLLLYLLLLFFILFFYLNN